MRFERLRAERDPAALAADFRALVPAPESVHEAVTTIINRVREGGDEALREYTRRFDTRGNEPRTLRVSQAELDAAAALLEPAVRAAIEGLIENVARVGQAALRPEHSVAFEHHQVTLRNAPVSSAGVYVPGGRAPYPSTVVMGVVSARVAGVERVAVCAPPAHERDLDPIVLAACMVAGADAVYRIGGAQAIAALAYGTQTVAPVDVIVGPGNLYVQEAKRQVFGQVGIDGFAGPSDLVVMAARDADPQSLSLDLLAQAEHGDGTLVIGISDDRELLTAVEPLLGAEGDTGAVVRLVEVGEMAEAAALAQELAPEHLELVGADAERFAPTITRAGCVFVGPRSATAFGDYIAGSNHVLPTNGAARFASGLSPATFRRSFTEVRIEDGSGLARLAAPLARAEGFELHARSMEARIRDNDGA